jgi:hypothetical protein
MLSELKFIFANVNDWLKFAEAKNAALIAFDGAVIIGLFSILKDLTSGKGMIGIAISIAIVFLAVSLFIALLSFYPQTRITEVPKNEAIDENDNLYFWEHIKKYTVGEYLKKFREIFDLSKPDAELENGHLNNMRLENDLAIQVITNSRITSHKYRYFNYALKFTIVGLLPLVIAFIVHMLCISNKG